MFCFKFSYSEGCTWYPSYNVVSESGDDTDPKCLINLSASCSSSEIYPEPIPDDEDTYFKIVFAINPDEAADEPALSDPVIFTPTDADNDDDPLTKEYVAEASYLVGYGSPKHLAWAFEVGPNGTPETGDIVFIDRRLLLHKQRAIHLNCS